MTKGNTVLGEHVRDLITNVEGVAIGYVEYLMGCSQVLIAPRKAEDKDKPPPSLWFDEQRVELTGDKPKLELDNTRPGGAELPPTR